MISASDMIGRVLEIVKGGSFEPPFVLSRINAAIKILATDVAFSALVVFDEEILVPANSRSCELPDNFFGSYIYRIKKKDDSTVNILANIIELIDCKSKTPLSDACLSGGRIRFNEPETVNTTLYITYNSSPLTYESIIDNGSNIVLAQGDTGEDAVMYLAASMLFSVIEGGIDGNKPNTSTFLALYTGEVARLTSFFGTSPIARRPEQVAGGNL